MRTHSLLEQFKTEQPVRADPLYKSPPTYYPTAKLLTQTIIDIPDRASPQPRRPQQRPGSTSIPFRRILSREESPIRATLKPNQPFRIVKRSRTPVKQTQLANVLPVPSKVLKTMGDHDTSRGSVERPGHRNMSPDEMYKRMLFDGFKTRAFPFITKEPVMVKAVKAQTFLTEEPIQRPTLEKEPEYFLFVIGKGNNDQVIRKVMQKRYWWKETYSSNSVFHFSWQQSIRPSFFEKLELSKGKQIVNHFEFQNEISTKINLIRNLQIHCEKAFINLFDITPTTFILDLEDPNFQITFHDFVSFFKEHSKHSSDQHSQIGNLFANIKPLKTLLPSRHPPPSLLHYSQPKMNDVLNNGCNLWLLKPAELNRGRGINLFNRLSSLEHYLKCFLLGDNIYKFKSPSSNNNPGKKQKDLTTVNLATSTKFVMQKYVERPMLIEGRKFDIRVWALVDQNMNLHFFREGYIRLSSEIYTLNEDNIENKFVHLTNNAIQKDGKNYGKHESGNIISLGQLKDYLPKDKAKTEYTRIIEKIKDLIRTSMKSIRDKLNHKERKYCFEIFGYDFFIDCNYHVWLIEVNTNPCLEESNDLLKRIIPRMIDDAFKLTIDKIIVPTSKNYRQEDIKRAEELPAFSVGNYDNDHNLWEHLANLRGVQIYVKLK